MQRSFTGRQDSSGSFSIVGFVTNLLRKVGTGEVFGIVDRIVNFVVVLFNRASNTQRIALGLIALLVLFSALPALFGGSNANDDSTEDGKKKKKKGPPPNPVTLVYPYNKLRDVVLNQPVDASDVPFFWHLHKSDELIVKNVLTKCYGLELVELNTLEAVQDAKVANLAARGEANQNFVVTSPFIRETCDMFTPPTHFGRMFCFFRHPLDYDLHEDLPRFEADDNWLTRLLSNEHSGDIGYKQLGVAKHVIRESCVVGTMDKMTESLVRIGKYFGWELPEGEVSCIEEIVNENNAAEKYMDHDSDEWNDFYDKNRLDCQLYEQAQSTWRAQIQTIVPFEIQQERANPRKKGDGDEEEGTEAEGGDAAGAAAAAAAVG